MRAAIYARVSTEEQTEGYSLEAQRDATRQYANSKGWEIVCEYKDGGFSGGNDRRPAFKQIIGDALAGNFDAILVHKLDRYSRNREDAIVYKSQLKKKSVRVISVSEPLDDSPASVITEAVLEDYNEYFLINLAHEIRKGKYKGAQNGNYQGGNLKFGYTLDNSETKPKIVADKQEAEMVATIYRKYAAGITQGQLTRWLNEQGIPGKYKGRWFKQKLSKILKDRTYIGEGRYGGVIMPYPPIVPTDLFNQVQVRLANKKHSGRPAKLGHIYLLSRLGRCGECSSALLHETQRQYRYIYCYRQSTYPDEHQCFKPKRWNLDWIEQEVWAEVDWILSDYKGTTYDLLLNEYENGKVNWERQMSKAKAEIERCKRERQTVLRQVRKGNITQAEADAEFTVISKEQADWQRELDNLTAIDTEAGALVERFMSQLRAVDKKFDYGFAPTTEQKKEILNLLLDKFILYKDGKIELRFKVPVNEKQVAEKIQELSCGVLAFSHYRHNRHTVIARWMVKKELASS